MGCYVADVAAAFAGIGRHLITELVDKRQVHVRGQLSAMAADTLLSSMLSLSYYNCCFGKMDRWKRMSYQFNEVARFQPAVNKTLQQRFVSLSSPNIFFN